MEYASPGDGRFIEREDRKIYVAEDQVFGEVDVTVYLEAVSYTHLMAYITRWRERQMPMCWTCWSVRDSQRSP